MARTDPGEIAFEQAQVEIAQLNQSWITNGSECNYSNVYCSLNTNKCNYGTGTAQVCSASGPTGICTQHCPYSQEQLVTLNENWLTDQNLDIQRRFFQQGLEDERRPLVNGECLAYPGWVPSGPTGMQMCARTAAQTFTEVANWKFENNYLYPVCYWDFTPNPQVQSSCNCLASLYDQLNQSDEWVAALAEWNECNDATNQYNINFAAWQSKFNTALTGEYGLLIGQTNTTSCIDCVGFFGDACGGNNDCDYDGTCASQFGSDWVSNKGTLCGVCQDYFPFDRYGSYWGCKLSDSAIQREMDTFAQNYKAQYPPPTAPCIPTESPVAPIVQVACCSQYFEKITAEDIKFNEVTQQCATYLNYVVRNFNDYYVNGITGATGYPCPEDYSAPKTISSTQTTTTSSSTSSSTNWYWLIGIGAFILLILIITIVLFSIKKKPAPPPGSL